MARILELWKQKRRARKSKDSDGTHKLENEVVNEDQDDSKVSLFPRCIVWYYSVLFMFDFYIIVLSLTRKTALLAQLVLGHVMLPPLSQLNSYRVEQ